MTGLAAPAAVNRRIIGVVNSLQPGGASRPARADRRLAIACLALVASIGAAHAQPEDVAKRWRLGFSIGGSSTQSEIESDSANILRFFSPEGRPQLQFIDPRPDASRSNTLAIRPGPIANLSGQYAFTRMFVLEGSVGYSNADVGNVEVHAQFDLPDSLDSIGFQFEPFLLPAGDVEIIPLQLSAMARFRSEKRFAPYVGGGIGYQLVDFKPSSELQTLSTNLESSLGTQSYMIPGSPEEQPNPIIFVAPTAPARRLEGASVDLPDSLTWHVLLGADFSIGQRWIAFVDLRFTWSSETATIAFNGEEDLGVAVPDREVLVGAPEQSMTYGPILITEGGLIDGGQRRPRPTQPPDTDCSLDPFKCTFDRSSLDGVPDNGFYYINGGTFDYSAFQFSAGVRYTF